jgi:hypothetical protein
MSQSQEAASAVRILQEQLRTANDRRQKILVRLAEIAREQIRLAHERDALVEEAMLKEREIGADTASIAAMEGRLGYGGAPAYELPPSPPRFTGLHERDRFR